MVRTGDEWVFGEGDRVEFLTRETAGDLGTTGVYGAQKGYTGIVVSTRMVEGVRECVVECESGAPPGKLFKTEARNLLLRDAHSIDVVEVGEDDRDRNGGFREGDRVKFTDMATHGDLQAKPGWLATITSFEVHEGGTRCLVRCDKDDGGREMKAMAFALERVHGRTSRERKCEICDGQDGPPLIAAIECLDCQRSMCTSCAQPHFRRHSDHCRANYNVDPPPG